MAANQTVPHGKPRFQLSRSTIFPLLGGRSAWSQEHLLPIVATVLVGVALLAVQGNSGDDEIKQAWQVYWIVVLYIAFLVNYYIYEICNRARGWWLIASVALFTFVLMATPIAYYWAALFYDVIPAAQWRKSSIVPVQLAGWFVSTGLSEEGFKAWPLFGLALLGAGLSFLGRHTEGRLRALLLGIKKHISLSEPLDGIILGVASGTGFFMKETLALYLPGIMSQTKDAGTQAFDGLVLLLARGLPDLAEHSAWSGLFGYFVGLAVLRPGMAIVLLPIGWLSAAALHAAWDGIGAVTNSQIIILGFWFFLGVLSYALLGGAIFKAREISPTSPFASGLRLDDARPSAEASAPLSRSDESDWD
jgi:RsiW-degrading membrane proteinase PrsW (M82 family)